MSNITASRKAALAATAGLVCLTWYILACVVSPVSWSPDGRSFVFLEADENGSPGGAIFRCEAETGRLTELIRSPNYLSAPVWSPDGKAICYLELGLPIEGADPQAAVNEVFANIQVMRFPTATQAVLDQEAAVYPLDLRLIKRDGSNAQVVASWRCVGPGDHKQLALVLAGYPLVFDPQSRKISFNGEWLEATAGARRPTDGKQAPATILNLEATTAVISPDGRIIAQLADKGQGVMFRRSEGSKPAWVKIDEDEPAGDPRPIRPVWTSDSQAVIAFCKKSIVRIDAHKHTKTVIGNWPVEPADAALSPDGKTLSFVTETDADRAKSANLQIAALDDLKNAKKVYTAEGEVLLRAPTWSPDGRRLALRRLEKGDDSNISRLLIFTRDGKLERTIDVPRPAARPATDK